jgi:hypothetical protein
MRLPNGVPGRVGNEIVDPLLFCLAHRLPMEMPAATQQSSQRVSKTKEFTGELFITR